jgi:hypothetical protein
MPIESSKAIWWYQMQNWGPTVWKGYDILMFLGISKLINFWNSSILFHLFPILGIVWNLKPPSFSLCNTFCVRTFYEHQYFCKLQVSMATVSNCSSLSLAFLQSFCFNYLCILLWSSPLKYNYVNIYIHRRGRNLEKNLWNWTIKFQNGS